jgi:hypothetical protein
MCLNGPFELLLGSRTCTRSSGPEPVPQYANEERILAHLSKLQIDDLLRVFTVSRICVGFPPDELKHDAFFVGQDPIQVIYDLLGESAFRGDVPRRSEEICNLSTVFIEVLQVTPRELPSILHSMSLMLWDYISSVLPSGAEVHRTRLFRIPAIWSSGDAGQTKQPPMNLNNGANGGYFVPSRIVKGGRPQLHRKVSS